ncbi:antibiotic biosynthesis monooxygenase [Nonomuraea mangrovi]|uniref:Antibiotic biosynthesis monooxygenase n=1 Tax=Nonomuraea mangrovi TaxID=2316207 RepID=A0ABW4T826_9ACTN
MEEEPVTLLFTWDVAPGRREAFERWLYDVNAAAMKFSGHLGVTWLRPGEKEGRYFAILRFTDVTSLKRWLNSDERATWVDRLDGIATEAEPRVSTTGMESWFSLPHCTVAPPSRWKTALTSFVAVYPCVLLFQWLLAGRIASLPLPLPLRAMTLPAMLSPLLTYALMPLLSRVLRRWLYR